MARLAKYLKEKKGLEVLVIAPDDNLENHSFSYQVYPVFGISFPIYPELKIPLPGYGEISKVLDEFEPDLIHLVTPFVIGLCGLKYAKDNDILLVASYHTNLSQYLKYYKFKILDSLLWKYFNWIHNQCEVNYCPSTATLQLLRRKGIKNLEIWDRGVDCAEFSPEYRNEELRKELIGSKEVMLLYVGRLAYEKDLDVLMNAMKRINNNLGNVCLVMTGDGPARDDLEDNAPGNVIFTGYKKGKELSEIYANADIFVFPSTTETFGNVILEAMASGLPVVAPMVGGVKDNLVHGYNGIACKPRNAKDMAGAVIRLARDVSYRRKLASQAREYALKKSWDEVFDRLFNSYQQVLEKFKYKTNEEVS
ncbi:glycosyltransferase family 1 protein [Peptococcaceae bacterium]|nr:glycosyltransferase family 1 protein [Peptococcaceae bacterium]